MKRIILILPLLFAISCTHTNELAKYDVDGAKIFTTTFVKPEASVIQITTVTSNQKKEKESVLEQIASSIGSDLITYEKRRALEKAIDTEMLIEKVAEGLENSLQAYLNMKSVDALDDSTDFICDIVLEECELVVEQNTVSIKMYSIAEIKERKSGELVWANSENRTNYLNLDFSSSKGNTTEQNLINTIQLLLVDEAKLVAAVSGAADEIGMEMGETLREDVIEANKDKNKAGKK